MVTEMIEYFGKECSISSTAAEALLAGIMLDTKNFVMRAGARTFEAAAYLRRRGADTVTVKKLFSGSVELYREKCGLIQSAELFGDCAVSAADNGSSRRRRNPDYGGGAAGRAGRRGKGKTDKGY